MTEFGTPICLSSSDENKVRIFRPNEVVAILQLGIPKLEYRTMFEALLYSGARYVEMQTFHENPGWLEGSFIHFPRSAQKKVKQKIKERWVRLNPQGLKVCEYFLKGKPLPIRQAWREDLHRWCKDAKVSEEGLSVKCLRKTWESFLMFYYPQNAIQICLSQGHTQATSLEYYLNLPFNEQERREMKQFVDGWI